MNTRRNGKKSSSSGSLDSLEHHQHHEMGSYFHVFSVYQRPAETDIKEGEGAQHEEEEEDDIIPLLRFSTQS